MRRPVIAIGLRVARFPELAELEKQIATTTTTTKSHLGWKILNIAKQKMNFSKCHTCCKEGMYFWWEMDAVADVI